MNKKIIIVSILLICNFAFLYHINNNDVIQIINTIATNKYLQKDNSELINAFEKNNGDGNAAYELFNIYFKSKQYDKAAQILHSYCLFVETKDIKKQQMTSKQTKNLIKLYKKLKASNKYRNMSKSDRSIILSGFELLKGNPQEADKYADEAFSNDKDKYALTLARYMTNKNDFRKAEYYYRKVLENDSKDYDSMYALTEIQTLKLKQYTKAITNCLKLMRVKYKFYDTLSLAMECCLKLNYDDNRFFKLLFPTSNIKDKDYDKMYFKLANIMLKMNKISVAKLLTNRIIVRNYDNLSAYFNVTELYTRNNLKREATEYFERTNIFNMNEEEMDRYRTIDLKINSMKNE